MDEDRGGTSRRRFLLAAAWAGGLSLLRPMAPLLAAEGDAGATSLASAAKRSGIWFGIATSYRDLASDPDLARLVRTEACFLVPENDGKWEVLRPSPNGMETAALDRLADFVARHSLGLRGHTLVWHEQNPPWLAGTIGNSAEARRLLVEHARAAARRYRGRMHSWDVVNEAVEPDHGRPDGLRRTPWLAALGPDYVSWAFEAAREGDPEARLTYNDYGLEYAEPWNRARRDVTLRLLGTLRERGLVDALGVQGHLFVERRFDPAEIQAFLSAVAALGLEVYITELDVCERVVSGDEHARDEAVQEHLREILPAFLDERAVGLVATWGAMTTRSWLNHHPAFKRHDGKPTRGLPFDGDGNRTPMGHALLELLSRAPRRS
jgi:endo-1,4-beta-xylanase